MKICTFMGHKDSPTSIKPLLKKVIESLITNEDIKNFYVGNHGNFDKMAISVLYELKNKYPNIKYSIVLAYIPGKKQFGK